MFSKLAFTAALAFAVATPVTAQSVGMQVVDTAGAPVGTVTAIQGDNLQVKTGKHEALLPKSSFRADGGKLLFGMTQAQLDAQIESTMASANAAIVAGATVKGLGGTPVGTIDSIADGKVVVTLQSGQKVAIPANGFRGNMDGTVTLGYSSAQLEALVKGSEPAAATAGQ